MIRLPSSTSWLLGCLKLGQAKVPHIKVIMPLYDVFSYGQI